MELGAKLDRSELKKYLDNNVIGFSNVVVKKIVNGKEVDIPAIRFYVKKKVPKSEVDKLGSKVIPEKIAVNGVEYITDIVEIGHIRARAGFTSKYRPAPSGVSTGVVGQDIAGTLGWFAIDSNGVLYALSCSHVWALVNPPNTYNAIGTPLNQPATLDGGTSSDSIFTLKAYNQINFSGSDNTVDIAIATVNSLSDVYTAIIQLNGIAGFSIPNVNDQVVKAGRTTGITSGTVIDNNATVNVDYGNGYTATFTDVIVVNGSSDPGDSGSPVIDSNNNFVGLLFAGGDNTFIVEKYNNIQNELTALLNTNVYLLPANSQGAYQPQQSGFFRSVINWIRREFGFTTSTPSSFSNHN